MTPRALIAWLVQVVWDFLGRIAELALTGIVYAVKGIIWLVMQVYARLVGDK